MRHDNALYKFNIDTDIDINTKNMYFLDRGCVRTLRTHLGFWSAITIFFLCFFPATMIAFVSH